MIKGEYKEVRISSGRVIEKLNLLGEIGWELVQIGDISGHSMLKNCFMKRIVKYEEV